MENNTNTTIRDIFDSVIAEQADADTVARLELCREYFTNPTFRNALEAESFRLAYKGQ